MRWCLGLECCGVAVLWCCGGVVAVWRCCGGFVAVLCGGLRCCGVAVAVLCGRSAGGGGVENDNDVSEGGGMWTAPTPLVI